MITHSQKIEDYIKEQLSIYGDYFTDWINESELLVSCLYEGQNNESILQLGFNLALKANGKTYLKAYPSYVGPVYIFLGEEIEVLEALHKAWRAQFEEDYPPRTKAEQKRERVKSSIESQIKNLKKKLESLESR